MTNDNRYTYYENETTTQEAMREDRESLDVRKKLRFDVDSKKVEKWDVVEIGKGLANRGMQVLEDATPGAGLAVDGAGIVYSGYQTMELEDSVLGGVAGAARLDELSETLSSKRTSFIDKIAGAFSWFGDKVVSFFKAIIPFGNTAEKVVKDASVVGDAAGKAVFASKLANIHLETRDVAELFHTEDKIFIQNAAMVLNQNQDGEIDQLELSAAHSLLDANKDGNVTKEEIDEHGGYAGALEFVKAHHRDRIDEEEYDERYGRYNLLRTLGSSSRSVVGSRFEELDMDKDGEVSRAEYREALGALDKDNNQIVTELEAAEYRDDPNRAFDIMIAHQQRNGR